MSRRKKKPKRKELSKAIENEFISQQELMKIFNAFIAGTEKTLTFSKCLTKEQRFNLHRRSLSFGMQSKSKGSKNNRVLTINKPVVSAININEHLHKGAIKLIGTYFKKHPFSKEETDLINHQIDNPDKLHYVRGEYSSKTRKRRRRYPEALTDSELRQFKNLNAEESVTKVREGLPMATKKHEFLNILKESNITVTILTGETGCGKSTQIPQFILRNAAEDNKPVQIVVTQPRRISAISLAERVAEELGEKVGNFVGYSVRLETAQSDSTKLLYCTTGTVLRSMSMDQDDNLITRATHVVLDEVHERDSDCDFLLTIIRDIVEKKKIANKKDEEFHVVLMSATLQAEKFQNYFKEKGIQTKHVHAKGSLYPITVHYLDTILPKIGFNKGVVDNSTSTSGSVCAGCGQNFTKDNEMDYIMHIAECSGDSVDKIEIKGSLATEIDVAPPSNFDAEREVSLYKNSRINRDLKKDFQVDTELIVSLLEFIEDKNDDVDLISKHGSILRFADSEDGKTRKSTISNKQKGAVLIFLNGWADISNIAAVLEKHPIFGQKDKFVIYPLHSGIDTKSQKEVFKTPPPGVRKIVLSTNIAETSVTINDVVYVIDTVTSKQLTHDPETSQSTLCTSFIDKSSSTQRAGRAGRVRSGVCFRLLSKKDYNGLNIEQVPELLRMSLETLCLQLASMKRSYVKEDEVDAWIASFLNKCLDSPPLQTIENALVLLRELRALDEKEELTKLGKVLSTLPVHPTLGKMLLASIQIGNIDGALSYCALETATREPFILTSDELIRTKQKNARELLAEGIQSDHAVNIALLDKWQKSYNRERGNLCFSSGVSYTALATIDKIKEQIKHELKRLLPNLEIPKRDTSISTSIIEFMTALSCHDNIVSSNGQKKTLGNSLIKNVDILKSSVVGRKPWNSIHGKSRKHEQSIQIVGFSKLLKTETMTAMINATRLSLLNTLLFAKTPKLFMKNINIKEQQEEEESNEEEEEEEVDIQNLIKQDKINEIADEYLDLYLLNKRKEIRKQNLKIENISELHLSIGGFIEIKGNEQLFKQIVILRERLEKLIETTITSTKQENIKKNKSLVDLKELFTILLKQSEIERGIRQIKQKKGDRGFRGGSKNKKFNGFRQN